MYNAERFAKLNGITWNPIKHFLHNPTFTDAKSILEVMMKRPDFENFINDRIIGIAYCDRNREYLGCSIYSDYILNPDKLLEEAISWCEKVK